jgi:hypothetical protein
MSEVLLLWYWNITEICSQPVWMFLSVCKMCYKVVSLDDMILGSIRVIRVKRGRELIG